MKFHSTPVTDGIFAARKFVVLVLLLFAFPNNLYAQPSTLIDNILTLPTVIVGDDFYHAEFELLDGPGPLEIELIEARYKASASTIGASRFAYDTLTISELIVDGISYWVTFYLVGDFTFELEDYGENYYGLLRNPVGYDIQPQWVRMPGLASDIGVGADGSIWALGADERGGGYGIYYFDGEDWVRVNGGAIRIDVDPDGNPWIINSDGDIYRYADGVWLRLPGSARDIGIGANGAVWVVSGGGVYNFNGIGWDRYRGSGVRIDVDPAGNPWVIDSTDDIYQLLDDIWYKLPGQARDIGIGPDGSVWITGTRSGNGGHGIYRWLGNDWNRVLGSGRQISVWYDGELWVVNSDGDIYSSDYYDF